MQATELPVEPRERTGKEAVAKLRQTGRIPAILYGAGGEPRALTVAEAEFAKALRLHGQRLSLLTLKIGSQSETAILKAIQRHPVHERIEHIDFLRIALDKPLSLEIPVRIEGVAAGVKFGGVLQQMLRHVRVKCLPTDIPEAAVADVSRLEIGHVLTAGELTFAGTTVELQTKATDAVVSVTVTKYEEETAAATPGAEAAAATGAVAASAEPAQPEVIGEKEREERRLKKDEGKSGREKEKAELKEVKAKEEKKK